MITRSFSLALGRKMYGGIIKHVKVSGIIWVLQKTHRMQNYIDYRRQLESLPPNTTGYALAALLRYNDLEFIPRYENHDLKHLVLGYGMTPVDEIKMQAYLLGNGNYSFACIAFLGLGLFMPASWREFYTAYKKGKSAPGILHLRVEDCATMDLETVKKQFAPWSL